MNNFENVKQMNLDELARFLQKAADKICFDTCEKGSGDKFQCPISLGDITSEDCVRCAKAWLQEEVTI